MSTIIPRREQKHKRLYIRNEYLYLFILCLIPIVKISCLDIIDHIKANENARKLKIIKSFIITFFD